MRSLAILCALAGVAHADGAYLSENVGGVQPGDEARGLPTGDEAEAHIGVRMGAWALELQFITALFNAEETTEQQTSLFAVGLGVRYIQPVSKHWAMYLRGRAMRGWGGDSLDGYVGNGLGAGAGIQLVGHARMFGIIPIAGSLFLDAGDDFYRLHGPAGDSIDITLPAVSLGWALGTDF